MPKLLLKIVTTHKRFLFAHLPELLLTLLLLNACTSNAQPTITSGAPSTTNITSVANTPTILPPTTTNPTNSPTTLPTLTATIPASATSSPTFPVATPTRLANNQAVTTTGCGRTVSIQPGATEVQTVAVQPDGARGSATRSYRLHLPANYKPNQPQAVLLAYHGYSGDSIGMEALTGFSKLADQQGFIAVYPQGIKDDDGQPMWASAGPIADYGIDELDFTNSLLNQLQKESCVDAHRVYATGFSNGGGMSNYLACKLSERITAVAPIAGNYFALPNGCQPGRAVALLEIHGTDDQVVFYKGRPNKDYPGWPMPAISDYLTDWANRNGCAKGPQIFLDTAEVQGQEWPACHDSVAVVHYQMKGGGHVYPNLINGRPIGEIIWSFLSKHQL